MTVDDGVDPALDHEPAIGELRRMLRADQVLTDAASLDAYAHDDAEWAPYEPPLAVVLAEREQDVSAVVRLAAASGLRVVPRGAGTGLSGGANAMAGSIVLSLERMTRIVEVNAAERYVVAEAGVINDTLREVVAGHGLWYPPDPASYRISTIGGNVATNAGGICCVKYGVTRDYVLGLRVVLADGDVVALGRRTAKGVTGYDLTALMVGSEGTLGIVTEVTLQPAAARRARGARGRRLVRVAARGRGRGGRDHGGGHRAVGARAHRPHLRRRGRRVAGARPAARRRHDAARQGRRGRCGRRRALAASVARIMADAGAMSVEQAVDAAEVDRLFLARRLAYPALERLGPVLTEDICVPRGAVPEMLTRIQATAAEHDVVIANIAHAGDGNLHPLIIAPEGDEAAKARAKLAFDRIVDDCRELGGTVTGEHGVGLLKLPGAREELGVAGHRRCTRR